MPTVHRKQGYRFYFYSHEPNEPPHVHVDKGGASLKAWLEPVEPARNAGFRPSEKAPRRPLPAQCAWRTFCSPVIATP